MYCMHVCFQISVFEYRERCDIVPNLIDAGCDMAYIENPENGIAYNRVLAMLFACFHLILFKLN